MTTQLLLIDDTDHDWKLDPRTRELGRRGVAQARIALRQAPRRARDGEADRGDAGHTRTDHRAAHAA